MLYYWIIINDAFMCKHHVNAAAGQSGATLTYVMYWWVVYNNASYVPLFTVNKTKCFRPSEVTDASSDNNLTSENKVASCLISQYN